MPTVGWIQEGDLDRYFEARSGATHLPVTRILFRCAWCGSTFASSQDLSRHTSANHPLELPTLHLRGAPLVRESVVRLRSEPSDVHLVQCTHCEVQEDGGDWQTISPEEFQLRFANRSDGVWNVRVVSSQSRAGAGVSHAYRIRFSIPDPSALDDVDQSFIRTLAVEELGQSDLTAFQRALPTNAAAREYAAALGDYALGVLLKEQRAPIRTKQELGEAVGRMRSALETLRHFRRPVAQVVSGVVRFNLNDFQAVPELTATSLDTGFRFFRDIAGMGPADEPCTRSEPDPGENPRSAACPIDTVSYQLLGACESVYSDAVFQADVEGLQLLSANASLNEYDIPKTHALCAYGFLRLGHPARARPHLRAIRFNPWLQAWVQRQLDEYVLDEK